MNAHTLAAILDDRRTRIIGLGLAALMAMVSLGFFVASKRVGSRLPPSAMREVLPERPYDLPIVRALPRQQNRNRIIDLLPANSTIARR